MVPEEQAEPEETAIPSRSSAIRAVCALIPGTANCSVLATRPAAFSPKMMVSGQIALRPLSSRWRRRRQPPRLALEVAHGFRHRGAEAGNADEILGAAAPVALLAAAETGAADVQLVAAEDQRADAHGTADLVRRHARRSAPNSLDIEQDLAKRLHRIDVQQRRPRHAPARPPRAPAGSRRSRCWPPSAPPAALAPLPAAA